MYFLDCQELILIHRIFALTSDDIMTKKSKQFMKNYSITMLKNIKESNMYSFENKNMNS